MTDQRWYAVLADAAENSNKFYDLRLQADGNVHATWGRVGSDGQSTTYTGGAATFDRKRNEKLRKGYRPLPITDSGNRLNGGGLVEAAKAGLIEATTTDTTTASPLSPVLTGLIERIARANKHQITAATGGRVTFTASGQATLPGGLLLTQFGIDRARDVLRDLRAATSAYRRLDLLQQYLSLVPHALGVKRGWEERVLRTDADFTAEADLLDALEGSLTIASAAAAPKVDFRYRVREATKAEFTKVKAEYERTRNAAHPVARLQVKRVFALTDTDGARVDAYAAVYGNVAARWHGTQMHNTLNILRTGLQFGERVAKSGFDYHGALLGPGIYTSSMSTKASGYSYTTWGGTYDNACFVLLADVARGREYRMQPGSDWRGSRRPDSKGRAHRSIEVYSAINGARNPETTVWDVDAVALRYLVELGN